MTKTMYFIAGLPRAGSVMVTNILKQNPDIHGEAVSSLSSLLTSVHANWYSHDANKEYENPRAKMGVLRGILHGYYKHIDRPIIVDRDRQWVSQIGFLEEILERPVKIVCMVRNPAEILTSLEKIRKHNPMHFALPDQALREGSTIASRAFFYAGPQGALGLAHAHLKDALTMGYSDRLLFVDYNRFCNSPNAQTKRIYEFFNNMPLFNHNFKQIEQPEQYDDRAVGLPKLHTIKSSVDRTTANCVEYLGLDLYQQYNSQIFWDALI
jgi:sulfotransferase